MMNPTEPLCGSAITVGARSQDRESQRVDDRQQAAGAHAFKPPRLRRSAQSQGWIRKRVVITAAVETQESATTPRREPVTSRKPAPPIGREDARTHCRHWLGEASGRG